MNKGKFLPEMSLSCRSSLLAYLHTFQVLRNVHRPRGGVG